MQHANWNSRTDYLLLIINWNFPSVPLLHWHIFSDFPKGKFAQHTPQAFISNYAVYLRTSCSQTSSVQCVPDFIIFFKYNSLLFALSVSLFLRNRSDSFLIQQQALCICTKTKCVYCAVRTLLLNTSHRRHASMK